MTLSFALALGLASDVEGPGSLELMDEFGPRSPVAL